MSFGHQRRILHVDLNAFYASVECLYRPEIRHLPVAVTGDAESRHGIILTKNQIAKKYGVQTGEAIWEAKKKCPGLMTVSADYPLYFKFSRQLREMLLDYSPYVEPFGLDEAWVDISQPGKTWDDAVKEADQIRERCVDELGITASVGVGDNKVYAKLGSDLKKPDATSAITPENYKEVAWQLPVSELLFVGPATTAKLKKYCVNTIGDLANMRDDFLQQRFGKVGQVLKIYARGEDISPVKPYDYEMEPKSVGNSTTTPVDVQNLDDLRCVYTILAECVSTRMREQGFRSRCISIGVRSTDLYWSQGQLTIKQPTSLPRDLIQIAMSIFERKGYASNFPFRSLGLHCSQLTSKYAPTQMDLFGTDEMLEKYETLADTIDWLRARFNDQHIIRLGSGMMNPVLGRLNTRDGDVYRPPAPPYFSGKENTP